MPVFQQQQAERAVRDLAGLADLSEVTESMTLIAEIAGRMAKQLAGVVIVHGTDRLANSGDRVVEVVPLWPNLQEIPAILGARVVAFGGSVFVIPLIPTS